MELLIILALILLNGIFSMSEIAIISARKTTLKNEAKKGNKGAKTAFKLQSNPDIFLSTIQIGITLIGILTGLYSGDVLAAKFSPYLESLGLSSKYAYPVAQVSIVIIVTYLSILFGELVPKRLALSSAEKIAKIVSQPMNLLSIVTRPFVWLLSKSTGFIFSLFGIKEGDNKVTEEEIKAMVHESALGGEIRVVEQDIVERVFTLGDRDLESIMTPRTDLVYLDIKMTKDQLKEIVFNSTFTKFPVVTGDLDQIEGIVTLKDLFSEIEQVDFNLQKILRPAQYFYESMEVYKALEEMKTNHDHFALIIDEFGTLSGVVSLKDILEAIVGEIPNLNEEPEIVKQKNGSYLVDGQCSFYNFLHYFKKTELYPQNEYNTVSGLLLEKFGHIPHPGEYLDWQGLHFEVLQRDGTRIDKVLIKLI